MGTLTGAVAASGSGIMPALKGIEMGVPGKQLGYAIAVHSDNVYDNSVIPVPVAVISSGPGPTALLVAGTHGDEYEGQVLLHELIRCTEPEHLAGTLIIVPAANSPAVRSGTRVSPIDGGNLNRSYPGTDAGGPTDQIAALIKALLPHAEIVVDLHSGGSNSTYLPCTFLYRGPNQELWRQKAAASRALGLPYVMVVAERLEPGSLSTAGDDAGILTLATELGGGGTVDPQILGIVRAGLAGLLHDVGVLAVVPGPPSVADEPCWIELVPESPVVSTVDGLFEPAVVLGQRVMAGDPVGRVHFIDELDRQPREFFAAVDGVVAILRRPTLVTVGSHLLHVAPEIDVPEA